MESVAGIAILVGLIVVAGVYQGWLRRSVRPRSLQTTLPVDEVKRLFESKVARMGWKIIDDDNPMVAQSGLLGGRRQEISMQVTPVDGGLKIQVWVSRMWTKGWAKVPYKAHTIRMRMNAFERAVATQVRADGAASTSTSSTGGHPVQLPVGNAVPASGPVHSIGPLQTRESPALTPMTPSPTVVPSYAVPIPSTADDGASTPWWVEHVVVDDGLGLPLGSPQSVLRP